MLKKKVVSSVAMTVSSHATREILQFVVSIILARLLVPSDYGLFGISAAVVGFIQMFSTLGFRAALIQRQNITDAHYSTAFWSTILLGISLCLLAVAASPVVALFFNEPILRSMVAVSSLGFIVLSLNTVHLAMLEKSMSFKKITIYEISVTVLSGAISLAFAFSGKGVWSLVLGGLLAQAILIPMPWMLTGWRPSLRYDKEAFRELFSFGAHLTGAGVVNYLMRNADNLIIGKYLGSSALGYYTLAYSLMLKPLQYVSSNVGRVLFPAFSSIKDDKARVRAAYLKVVQFISLITFPMMTGLLFIAPDFIEIVYGAKWVPTVPVFQILCLLGAVQSIGTTVGSIYLSQGRADLQFKYTLVFAPIVIISFFIGVNWGIEGVAWSYLAASGGIWLWSHVVANRLISLDLKSLLWRLVPATAACVIMYLVLAGITHLNISLIENLPRIVSLATFIAIGVCSYSISIYLISAKTCTELIQVFNRRGSL